MRAERSTDIRRRESPIRNLGHAEVGVVRARERPEALRHSQISRVSRREIATCAKKDLSAAKYICAMRADNFDSHRPNVMRDAIHQEQDEG